MTARIVLLGTVLFAALHASALCAGENVLTDDFSREVAGRWERVAGDWTIGDGRIVHHGDGRGGHDMAVVDFPFSEGMIEVEGVAHKKNEQNFASLGFVIKYVDAKNNIWFRFGSYGRRNVDGYAPGFNDVSLGRGKPELGRKYKLTVIVRNGLIVPCIDGVMIGVLRDPLAGKVGRPGLFSEADVEYDNFRVTRYAC